MEKLAYRAEEVPAVFPIGKTKLFELIATGEIESIKVGRARIIPAKSLQKFMDDRLRAEQAGPGGGAA